VLSRSRLVMGNKKNKQKHATKQQQQQSKQKQQTNYNKKQKKQKKEGKWKTSKSDWDRFNQQLAPLGLQVCINLTCVCMYG
jgi:hypothetical protein